MIDWYGVAVSALWVIGLAELLATLSCAYWLSSVEHTPGRRVLAVPSFRLVFSIGIMLFALGMLFTVDAWWEEIGWVILVALAIWEGAVAWRAWHAETKGG